MDETLRVNWKQKQFDRLEKGEIGSCDNEKSLKKLTIENTTQKSPLFRVMCGMRGLSHSTHRFRLTQDCYLER